MSAAGLVWLLDGGNFWCAFEDGEVTVIGDEPTKHPL
jgi:hypothetical protein